MSHPLQSRTLQISGRNLRGWVTNQVDARWAAFDTSDKKNINAILDSPYLQHWAAENLDELAHHRLKPLPLGMVFSDGEKIQDSIEIPQVPKLEARPLRILCAHRVREGAQWETRKKVTENAQSQWAGFCTVLEESVPERTFTKLLSQHTFVICAEGGGLDPSPKAWLSVLHGAIPIIKKNTLEPAYRHLPVAFIDNWDPTAITEDKLLNWKAELAIHYELSHKRREVLRRLSLDYWWDYVTGFSVK